MHFRLSSRLTKSVKAKCRTISDQYTNYRRNRKIAKSNKSPGEQIPQTQQGATNPWKGEMYRFANDSDDWDRSPGAQTPQTQQGAANPWKGEPYRFANDSDDWDKNLVSDSESELDSACAKGHRISVEEEDSRCEYDLDSFVQSWLLHPLLSSHW